MDHADTATRLDAGIGAQLARKSDGALLRRWLGSWIDLAVAFVLVFAVAIPVAALGPPELGAAAGITAAIAYFPLCEGRWGRTAGKLITGTIVVDRHGQTPGYGPAVLRTLTRVIEVNPFLVGGLPAGLIASFNEHHQRLGDMLAKTYVVRVKDLNLARTKAAVAEAF